MADQRVDADPETERRAAATRIVLRPLANPFPLGFYGLAAATLLVSGLELGWFSGDERRQAALIVLVLAPPIQLVASVFGYLARDPDVATGMGVLAVTWAVIGAVGLTGGSPSAALGVLLLVSGTALLLTCAGTAVTKLVPAAVLGLAGSRYILSGIHQTTNASGWQDAAGIVGIVTAAAALYAGIALTLEDLEKRPVLPIGRRRRGAQAQEGTFVDQIREVASEAGIRKQL